MDRASTGPVGIEPTASHPIDDRGRSTIELRPRRGVFQQVQQHESIALTKPENSSQKEEKPRDLFLQPWYLLLFAGPDLHGHPSYRQKRPATTGH